MAEPVFTTRPELRGTFGMVASTHWLASATGMAVLESGGNAFDAAAAAGFVLQVVEPHLNGPGGEVPIVAWVAERGEAVVICGQGCAPEAATIERMRDLGIEDPIPGTGLLPACVPGAFGGWMLMLAAFGTLSPRDVLTPAIGYAESGFPLLERIAETIASVQDLFREHWPTSAQTYLGRGLPRPGRLFRNLDLAATYRRIVAAAEAAGTDRDAQIEAALDAFYRGFVAEAIDRFCSSTAVMDVTGRSHRGLLSGDDLARWRATLETPVTLTYHGYTVCKPGPWSQGPVALQQLALLDGFDLADVDPLGEDLVHTVVECAKLALADRDCFYGDPEHVDVPLEDLLSPDYARLRRAELGDDASGELRPGSPGGHAPVLPPLAAVAAGGGPGAGEPTLGHDTCHVDVADRFGNLVSATPSGGWLQSSPVVPGLGFPLGTRAQMFWLDPRHPNALAPGKRPRTTLSPSLALRDGDGYLAFGTPGGDQQDQWPLIAFLRHIHHGMDLQAAIDAPCFHTEHLVSSFYPRPFAARSVHLERRFGADVFEGLRRRGHDVIAAEPWSLGRVGAAGREPDGVLKAAADPRGMQGYAVGR